MVHLFAKYIINYYLEFQKRILQERQNDKIANVFEKPLPWIEPSGKNLKEITTEEPFAPPRTRKTGLWTDSTPKSGKSRKDSTFSLLEQERLRSPSPTPLSREDSEDDIPLIEEIQEDDYLGDFSEAPQVPLGTVTSFSQLNSDLKKYAAFSIVDNINLGLLAKHLFNESDLKEGDNRWSWDLLFTEVASDLRSEWEQNTVDLQKLMR